MPYVNIKITDEHVSREQKQALVERTTQMLVDILDKDPRTTMVVIDEVMTDNWSVGADLVSTLRAQRAGVND